MTDTDLAWRIAEVAADPVAVPAQTQAMVINRIIDNAAVSAASMRRRLVSVARAQARAHRNTPGACLFGIDGSFSPEWAAFANGVAARELEYHDAFIAGHHANPGDTIPALVAVAQHTGLRGTDLIRGIATAYEVQISLARSRSAAALTTHLGVSIAAGLGTMLRLRPETIHAAIGHATHLTAVPCRDEHLSRSGWELHTPALAGRLAIEAVDRAMRGDTPPWPGGFGHADDATLPAADEFKRAILSSYPRQHCAAYHGQATIDLALRLHPQVGDIGEIVAVVLYTGHHIPGASDPAEVDPAAPRSVLSRSVPYLFSVALQDGGWHHHRSYAPERAHRPDTIELCRRVCTTAAATEAGFAVRAEITLRSGEVIVDEQPVADAHPAGARPFTRNDYMAKFSELAEGIIDRREQQRFLDVAVCLSDLKRGALGMLNPLVENRILDEAPTTYGIFR